MSTPLLHSAVGANGMLPDSRSSKRQCPQHEFRRQLMRKSLSGSRGSGVTCLGLGGVVLRVWV